MADATKFFKEAISLLPDPAVGDDPALTRERLLTKGLLALAKQLDEIQSDLKQARNQIASRIR